MSDVRILPLGVGDAFSAENYSSCLALGAGDTWVLVDCPHPIRKMLREASHAAGCPLDLGDITAVVLTHLHADHVSGLEDYAYFSRFVLRRRARVLTHPDVSAKLWSGVLGGGMGEARDTPGGPMVAQRFDDFFELTDLDTERPVRFGPLEVECRFTRHPVPTTALRIKASGRMFAHSADTAFDPDLIDWLAAADLIVHEVTPLPSSHVHTPYAHLTALPSHVHTPYAHLTALPGALCQRLRLTHYPDEFDPDASRIEPLRPGRLYPV
jgi:ribonuclease BN (tRNA processing enzyme)